MKKYHVYAVNETENSRIFTHAVTIDAKTIADAHKAAAERLPHAEQIAVYTDTAAAYGIMLAAVSVAAKCALRAVTGYGGGKDAPKDAKAARKAEDKAQHKAEQGGGTSTQWRLANELQSARAMIDANDETTAGEKYAAAVVERLSADAQDLVSAAYAAIIECDSTDAHEKHRAAYKAVNAAIHAEHKRHEKEVQTEYIQDGGGDLIAINRYIARIINGGERFTPTDGGEMDSETAGRLGDALTAALRTLSNRQRTIAAYIARGYSYVDIAAKVHVASVATIAEHIRKMRVDIAAYFAENAAEFMPIIADATAAAQAQADSRRADRHTDASKAAAKATQAARAKAYRERKKAAAQAAAEKQA